MSLTEAISEIAEDMEDEAREFINTSDKSWAKTLSGFAKQLRIAIKASEEITLATIKTSSSECSHVPRGRGYCHCSAAVTCNICGMCVHCQKPSCPSGLIIPEFSKTEVNQKAVIQEIHEGIMTECIDGPADMTMIPRNPEMPVGAKMMVVSAVYILQENKTLLFSEADTKEVRAKMVGDVD